jgi:hypothetical protein
VSNIRYAQIQQLPSQYYKVAENQIKDMYRAESVQVWSARGNTVNGQHDAVVRITLSDAEKLTFFIRANHEIVVEGGQRYRVRAPLKCSACQSNDHRAYDCKWKKVLGKITFDIQAVEGTPIALRT